MNHTTNRHPSSNNPRNDFRRLAAIIFLAVSITALLPEAHGDDSNATPVSQRKVVGDRGDILIKDGVVLLPERRTAPATLGNVIEFVFRARYPNANFILAPGLNEVPVADLKVGNIAASAPTFSIGTSNNEINGPAKYYKIRNFPLY